MARMTEVNRDIAIGRLQAGQATTAVARHFAVHRSTISRLWVRFGATGSVRDLPRSRRPRVTTPGQDRRIRLNHLRNRTQSAARTVATEPDRQHIHPRLYGTAFVKAGCTADVLFEESSCQSCTTRDISSGRKSIDHGLVFSGVRFGLVTNPASC